MTNDPTRTPKAWRRKTPLEVRAQRRRCRVVRINPIIPAMQAIGGAALLVAALVVTGVKGNNFRPVPLLEGLDAFVPIAIVLFIGIYAWRLWWGPPKAARLFLCTKCFELFVERPGSRCPCGGALEDADGWTKNRCPKCGYNLCETTARCPECGRAVDRRF